MMPEIAFNKGSKLSGRVMKQAFQYLFLYADKMDPMWKCSVSWKQDIAGVSMKRANLCQAPRSNMKDPGAAIKQTNANGQEEEKTSRQQQLLPGKINQVRTRTNKSLRKKLASKLIDLSSTGRWLI